MGERRRCGRRWHHAISVLIRQKINQSDLAAMAGLARENVSRVLKEWTEHGIVSRLAGYYCLEKKDAIQSEAEPTA
jgi:CRP-like cAMP-binding protein